MQVFADYLKFFSTHGPGPRFLPTPCFYYGMEIGKEFTQTFSLPSSLGEQSLVLGAVFILFLSIQPLLLLDLHLYHFPLLADLSFLSLFLYA